MTLSCNTIVDRKDNVHYLTVSKSYSDECTCSKTEQYRIALNDLYNGAMLLYEPVHEISNNVVCATIKFKAQISLRVRAV